MIQVLLTHSSFGTYGKAYYTVGKTVLGRTVNSQEPTRLNQILLSKK